MAYSDEIYREFRAAQRGDESALGRLLELLMPRVLLEAARLLDLDPDRFEVRDAATTALTQIALHLDQCRATAPFPFWMWVVQVAKNSIFAGERSAMRRRAREDRIHGLWPSSRENWAEEFDPAYQILMRTLDAVADALSEGEWDLIVRRERLAEPFAAIGQSLGINAKAAEGRYRRLRNRMRQAFLRQLEELPEEERNTALTRLGLRAEREWSIDSAKGGSG